MTVLRGLMWAPWILASVCVGGWGLSWASMPSRDPLIESAEIANDLSVVAGALEAPAACEAQVDVVLTQPAEPADGCNRLRQAEVVAKCAQVAMNAPEQVHQPKHRYGVCRETSLGFKTFRSSYDFKSKPYRLKSENGVITLSHRVRFDLPSNRGQRDEIRRALMIVADQARLFFKRQGIEYRPEWEFDGDRPQRDGWPTDQVKVSLERGLPTSNNVRLTQYLTSGSLFTAPGVITTEGGLHPGVGRTLMHELLHRLGIPDDYVAPDFMPVECPVHFHRRNHLRAQYMACADPLLQGPTCENIMIGGQSLERAVLPADYLARLLSPICPAVCAQYEPRLTRADQTRLVNESVGKSQRELSRIQYDRTSMIERLRGIVTRIRALPDFEAREDYRFVAAELSAALQRLESMSTPEISLGVDSGGQTRVWNEYVSKAHFTLTTAPAELRPLFGLSP